MGADEGGAVNGNGSRGHLANGNKVGKLGHGEPAFSFHNVLLNQRDGGVAAAEREKTDFKKFEE